MIKRLLPFLPLFFLFACNHADERPDVSGIPVDEIHIVRYDTAFFDLDSNHVEAGLFALNQRYPFFTQDFVANILGAEPLTDTSRVAFDAARQFLVTYMPVRDSIEPKFRDLGWLEKQLQQGFRYVKYYFPAYRLPPKVVAFIGPFDGPGVAMTTYTLALGLQSYAGKDFGFYLTSKGQDMYPIYISRRFTTKYMVVNSLNAIAQDIFPDSSDGRPLIEQMV